MIFSLSFDKSLSKSPVLLLSLIVAFYLINGIFYLRSQSLTSDEGSFYSYAKRFIKGQSERVYPVVDNSTTPVIVLNLVPRVVEQWLKPGTHKTDWGAEDIFRGRYISLLVSVLVILLVHFWARDLYGIAAGLFAAFLMSFSPNFLANAALVTTDGYSTLLLLASLYLLWRMTREPSLKSFVFFSVAVALAQLVKQSLFHLYVLIPLLLFVYFLLNRPSIRPRKWLQYAALFVLIQWLVINAGYYFYRTNLPLGDYHFMSHLFQSVQHMLPGWIRVPLPKPFLDSLDMAKYYDQIGGGFEASSFGKVTILNHDSIGGAFWYYYIVSIFFKAPVAYFILIIWAIRILTRGESRKGFGLHELFLLFPILYFLFVMSFLYKTQIGIRHLIFLIPLVCILCSSVVPKIKTGSGKAVLACISLYLVLSVMHYWKNYYPYTNEFIWNKTFAYQYVGASNLQFHQDGLLVSRFLKEHPTVRLVTAKPDTGVFLIPVDDDLDIWSRHQHDWIKSIGPCGQVGFASLLIRVNSADLHR